MGNEDTKKIREDRINVFRQSTGMKEIPYRIAHISDCLTWNIHDAGYLLSEAIYNYDIMEKTIREHMERYNPDLLLSSGTRNPLKIIQGFSEPAYSFNDEEGYINALDVNYMHEDEYSQIVENKLKYLWETLLPRRYPELKNCTIDDLKGVIERYREVLDFGKHMGTVLREDYGTPIAAKTFVAPSCIEMFTTKLRGIKGISIDLRKRKSELMKAIEFYEENEINPAIKSIYDNPGPDNNFAFDVTNGCLSHNILNQKQWEEIYWPSFKKAIDATVETNKTFYIFIQGSVGRFKEYFQDIPKGHIAIQLEQDDVFEARKWWPNLAIIGGMPVTKLGSGTPEECVDYTKKLIDEVGANGGYMFSTDKMLSFRKDANRENLLAVSKFLQDYRTK